MATGNVSYAVLFVIALLMTLLWYQ